MDVSRVTVALKVADRVTLPPFKGSTFRGALGGALKGMVCIRRDGDCSQCLIKDKCAYIFLFETELCLPVESRERGGVPRPFVLEPPLEEYEVYEEGQGFYFGLVLLGDGIDYVPYLIAAIERMGEYGIGRHRGKFFLESVNDGFTGRTIYERENCTVYPGAITRIDLNNMDLGRNRAAKIDSCRVTLLTPLRLKNEGSLTAELDFLILLRAILRRLHSIHKCLAPETDPLVLPDNRPLLALAADITTTTRSLTWYDWERYSQRQQSRMKLGGLVGQITFAGDLTPFWPLLVMGELVHIGKNTTFGLGQYRLAVDG